jgi:transcriptional regulator with XRE-family HTH domain
MITPAQSRAARGWLSWSQEELARRAKVSPSTVRDFEKGRHAPIMNNLEAIRRAFESQGIEFLFRENGAERGVVISIESKVA